MTASHPAVRLSLALGLLSAGLMLWAPAILSRTSRDNVQVLGLYSLGYGAIVIGYGLAVVALLALALAAQRGWPWLAPLEQSLAASARRPWLAGVLALAATCLTGTLALALPSLFTTYSVRFGLWAAWGLGVAYLAPLAVWGLPALVALHRALRQRGQGRWALVALAGLALGMRLIGISAPPLDTDSTRQPFTLVVAEYLCRAPAAPTQISVTQAWRGTPAQLQALRLGPLPHPEVFPLYQWLVGRLFCAFGPATALARLVSLAGWLIGCAGLYGYVRRWHGTAIARWALLLYTALPLSLYFSRVAVRQSLDVGLSLAGLYAVSEWAAVPRGRRSWLWAGALLIGAAIASYPPLAVVGMPVLALVIHKHSWRFVIQPTLWVAAGIALLPAALWYLLASDNGSVLTADGRTITQVSYFFQWLSLLFVRRFPATVINYLTLPWGLALLIPALLCLNRRRRRPLRWAGAWAVAGVLCLATIDPVAAFASQAGMQHLYVYLILAPPLAVLMAGGLSSLAGWLRRRQLHATSGALAFASAAAILVPGLFFIRPLYAQPAHAAEVAVAIRAATQPNETFLLLTGDIGLGYLAGRRGAAYDVLRGDLALSDRSFQALLCAGPAVVVVADPVEMQAAAPAQLAFLYEHYPVMASDGPGLVFDTRRLLTACN